MNAIDPKLREYARMNRQAGNLAEALLWGQLRNSKLNGLKFQRQKVIDHYIVDFICFSKCTIIEIDGESHDRGNKPEYDAVRNAYLEGQGFSVIHILDTDVRHNLNGVVSYLKNTPSLTRHPS
jgi:very-short-patch-repair endonuclease